METQLIYQGLHNVSAYSVYKGRCCHSKAVGLSVRVFYPVYQATPASSALCCTQCWRPSAPPLLQIVLLSQNLSAPYVLRRAALQGVRKGAGKEETWTFYFFAVDSMAGLLWRVMAC